MAGLDYLSFGDWQQQYGRWLVDSLGLKGKKLLDVGCACGSIVRGFGEAGAIVHGVDVNEHMIRLGREKWPDMAPLLGTCDAVNLHLYTDGSWDAIHTAQVAEHWKPQLVPHILQEFARVVRPGGLLFCALDTEELFTRQGRTAEREDPTHICVRPMRWWQKQLVANGWQVCTAEFESRLRNHPQSYLKRYDWDWFVAQRAPVREEINSNSPQPVETTTSVLAPPPPTPQPSRPSQPQRPSTKVGSSPPASRPVSSQSTGSTLPPNNSPPSVPAASDQMPPLSTQIWNVMGSLAAFVADGAKTVSAEEYQRRLEICETCPRRRRNRCLECGCRLSIKAQARAMRCPLGKWA